MTGTLFRHPLPFAASSTGASGALMRQMVLHRTGAQHHSTRCSLRERASDFARWAGHTATLKRPIQASAQPKHIALHTLGAEVQLGL